MRIACLIVPALPLQAWLRAEPDLVGQPLVVVEGEGVRTRVVDVSDAARALGAARGQLLSEAQVLVPSVVRRTRSEVLESAAREAVIDAATRVSPRVEETEPGVVLVDATGLQSVWGEDRAVASALLAAAHRLGFLGRAGVSTGKRLARLAADRTEGVAVVTEADVPSFLARLPLSAFTSDAELLLTLQRWGLRSGGDLSAIPADDVGTRLGRAGLDLLRQTQGVDDEPLAPRPEPETYAEAVELDYAIEQVEPLMFLLRPALERLLARLDCRGRVVGALVLRFQLDPRGEHPLPVGLAAPTRELDDLLALCRQTTEKHPPQEGVRGFVLLATPAEIRHRQMGLFDLPSVAPAKLMGDIAQVAALVGADRVGRVAVVDRHLPDAARLRRFEPPPAATSLDQQKAAPPPRVALRRYRPPLALEITVTEAGQMDRLRARGVSGKVAVLAGPWRIDAEWYLAGVVHDAYDVSLQGGRSFLIGRDRITKEWWVFGEYD